MRMFRPPAYGARNGRGSAWLPRRARCSCATCFRSMPRALAVERQGKWGTVGGKENLSYVFLILVTVGVTIIIDEPLQAWRRPKTLRRANGQPIAGRHPAPGACETTASDGSRSTLRSSGAALPTVGSSARRSGGATQHPNKRPVAGVFCLDRPKRKGDRSHRLPLRRII